MACHVIVIIFIYGGCIDNIAQHILLLSTPKVLGLAYLLSIASFIYFLPLYSYPHLCIMLRLL